MKLILTFAALTTGLLLVAVFTGNGWLMPAAVFSGLVLAHEVRQHMELL